MVEEKKTLGIDKGWDLINTISNEHYMNKEYNKFEYVFQKIDIDLKLENGYESVYLGIDVYGFDFEMD